MIKFSLTNPVAMKSIFECLIYFLFLSIQVRMSWNNGDNKNLFLKSESKLELYHVALIKPRKSPKKYINSNRIATIVSCWID